MHNIHARHTCMKCITGPGPGSASGPGSGLESGSGPGPGPAPGSGCGSGLPIHSQLNLQMESPVQAFATGMEPNPHECWSCMLNGKCNYCNSNV